MNFKTSTLSQIQAKKILHVNRLRTNLIVYIYIKLIKIIAVLAVFNTDS